MTPLALAIAKEALLPPRKRTFQDKCGLLNAMSDIHCFEVSAVSELAMELHARLVEDVKLGADGLGFADDLPGFTGMADATSFLPAPKTWIEWRLESGFRRGFLLVEEDGWARIYQADGGSRGASMDHTVRMGLGAKSGDAGALEVPGRLTPPEHIDWSKKALRLNVMLALINTPRVVERQQHAPHAGFERKLSTQGAAFRLHPWNEIKLEVLRPAAAGVDGAAGESLTGQKALHFCRAHLRVRRGRVEIVSAHWRGDAALGVQRSRYRVVPPSPSIGA